MLLIFYHAVKTPVPCVDENLKQGLMDVVLLHRHRVKGGFMMTGNSFIQHEEQLVISAISASLHCSGFNLIECLHALSIIEKEKTTPFNPINLSFGSSHQSD